jgi:hypothetical protein
MTIERERNYFGLYNRTKVLEEGAREVLYHHIGWDSNLSMIIMDVMGPDTVRIWHSIVLHPTDRHHAPYDKVEFFQKEEINEQSMGRKKFGITDKFTWKKQLTFSN